MYAERLPKKSYKMGNLKGEKVCYMKINLDGWDSKYDGNKRSDRGRLGSQL